MYEENFPLRLAKLRNKKGVSARDMSLSIGQNPGYINSIESGKALPSMNCFFYICDYLNISPRDFFEEEMQNPQKIREATEDLKLLDEKQLETISEIIKYIIKK